MILYCTVLEPLLLAQWVLLGSVPKLGAEYDRQYSYNGLQNSAVISMLERFMSNHGGDCGIMYPLDEEVPSTPPNKAEVQSMHDLQ